MASKVRGPLGRGLKHAAHLVDRMRPPGRGVAVLIYHRVGGRTSVPVDLPTPLFRDQMAALSGRAVSLDEALQQLQGRAPAGGDPVVVTFDDGTADVVEEALPVLVEHRVPALLYVATDFVEQGRDFPDDGRVASWAALRDAMSTGYLQLGSHTHTHALLDRLDPASVADELDRSIELIGERTGVAPRHFAYPKALASSPEADREVRARFASAAVAGTQLNRYGTTDPWELARSPIQVADEMRWFEAKAAGGLGLEDDLRRLVNRVRYRGGHLVIKPKVIHVTTVDMSLELLIGPQLRAFAAAGYEVVGASAPGPYVRQLEASGIRHEPLHHATRSMDPGRDVRFVAELVRLLRRERPDIVHLHNPKPGWFGRPAAAAARVPAIVNTVHGLYATADDPLVMRTIVYALERFGACFSDVELVQNPEDVSVLRRLRVPSSKLVTLGNGIDLDRFTPGAVDPAEVARVRAELGGTEDTVLVGAVSRLVWEKGLAEVFEAAARLREERPEARFVVVGPLDPEKGDGLGPRDLERISAETGIVFAGERSDIEVVYAALDVYLLASHREGWPRSAMEASAMGVPVVATDIRGCRQVVDHEISGLLFPVGDAQALGDALERIVDDGGLRGRLADGARARAIVEFDQQRQIDLTLAAYERLRER